ncbi:MAG: hypothetical protein ACXW5U_20030 [Thermoanaerobaculia bacterium]
MKNKLVDLRDHLFATLEALRDEEKPMDLERARTIAHVARELVASAKVEVDFLKAAGERSATDFFPVDEEDERRPRRLTKGAGR